MQEKLKDDLCLQSFILTERDGQVEAAAAQKSHNTGHLRSRIWTARLYVLVFKYTDFPALVRLVCSPLKWIFFMFCFTKLTT